MSHFKNENKLSENKLNENKPNREEVEVMADDKKRLTKKDLISIWWRTTFLMASYNYERMQNLGFLYGIMPAIRRLYKDKADKSAAMKRHLEFYNTHPYMAWSIMGVVASLEEDKANGGDVDDAAVNGVKVGMMGPFAGVGDPIFWGTLRPILGAFAASLAVGGSLSGFLVFFLGWNIIRMSFAWFTQSISYREGTKITGNMQGNQLQKFTMGASIVGMFIMGVLVPRWTTINLSTVVSSKTGDDGVQKATTLNDTLNGIFHGLPALLLFLFCIWLLRRKVNPIIIIFGLFALGILGFWLGFLALPTN
ncbi:MAG: PTS system mannose/fructose/sorbose family transporter subunit IID [Bifidobacteriaceae bacterium]|jgi:PTS system mannose-specific IID component|nr:PTS system mannose/fructose/sorbose family transporter subunit IID [Bifidobacteriaceae bacterium]